MIVTFNLVNNRPTILTFKPRAGALPTIQNVEIAHNSGEANNSEQMQSADPTDTWTPIDENLLSTSSNAELALWRHSDHILRCFPPELLPASTWVDSGNTTGFVRPAEGSGIFSHNWPANLCNEFMDVLMIPALKGDKDTVTFALAAVMCRRLLEKPAPSEHVLFQCHDENKRLRHQDMLFLDELSVPPRHK